MTPQTRKTERKPIWDSYAWLEENYESNNGVPKFFVEGEYTYDMKEIAEYDYKHSIDQALKSNNTAFSTWAQNIKNNDYSPLMLTITRDFWKSLIEEEIRERKSRKLNESILGKNQVHKKQRRLPPIQNDLLYLDGLRKSVGTIIKDFANTSNITDYKSNYFTTLAMNSILDISDISTDSHLDLFTTEQQELIIKNLSLKPRQKNQRDTVELDNIIEKYSNIEDNDRFLRKCVKQIEYVNNNNCNKNIYIKILKSLLNDKYLYDQAEDNSEADYVNKLYSCIMETCFEGYNIRLRWGDTIPDVCKKVNYKSKIDLRVTIPSITCIDLSVVEYAKRYSDSKYYKDKLKIVLCSIIYFRHLLKKTNNYDIIIPSMIISRLEGELLIVHLVNKSWFVVQKLTDVDTPPNVELVKDGAIKNYVNELHYFKDYCLNLKNQSTQVNSKAIRKESKRASSDFQKKTIWFSDYKGIGDTSDEE